AVREAGALALKSFGQSPKSWTKHGNSPVSEVDIAIDALLRARLLDADDAWLSEEGEHDPERLKRRRVWVIDPIDGTRAYLAGRTDWSVAAALVEDGRPTVGALFAPASQEFFLAALGEGATRNGVPMAATSGTDFAGARFGGPAKMSEWLATQYP